MNRKHVAAWALYDFASSIYSSVIASAVFAVYYAKAIVGNEAGRGDQMWGWAMSGSALIIALSAPLLGSVADRAGVRKRLWMVYVLVGLIAVVSFGTLEPGMAWRGLLLALIANVGFEGAQVFYNAYLPDIAPPSHQGRVSGIGFGLGYLGSAVGLLAAIPLAQDGRFATIWLIVAAWWVVFAIPAFVTLPEASGVGESVSQAAVRGVRDFRRLVGEVLAIKQLRRFLIAYFFYIDGVNTVVAMAAIFASTTLGFLQDEIIKLFLVVQISALIGALVMAKPTDSLGPKKVVLGTLVLWAVVAISAFFVTSKGAFFAVAVIAGTGLGTVQAASRSFMSRLIPEGKEAEMFGFYAFCGKTSSIMGPLLFGTVSGDGKPAARRRRAGRVLRRRRRAADPRLQPVDYVGGNARSIRGVSTGIP
jgi:MFS transporter, UMF1 family